MAYRLQADVSGDLDGESQRLLDRSVSPEDAGQRAVDLARREFGRMARVVFRRWGINQTDDIGEIVFNLIDASLLSKQESDKRSDFHVLFDLDEALLNAYEIKFEPAE